MIVDPSNRDCTCSRNVKKPLCEENYETGPQTLSVRLRFLTIRAEGCTLTTQIINQIRRQITDPETLHFDSRVRRQTSRTVYQAGFVVSRHVNYRRGVFPALMGYISDFSTIRTAADLPSAKFGVPVCPHAGGGWIVRIVHHLSIFDFLCVGPNWPRKTPASLATDRYVANHL
jgi:hypothetical protein